MCAVSLLEIREQRCIKANNNNTSRAWSEDMKPHIIILVVPLIGVCKDGLLDRSDVMLPSLKKGFEFEFEFSVSVSVCLSLFSLMTLLLWETEDCLPRVGKDYSRDVAFLVTFPLVFIVCPDFTEDLFQVIRPFSGDYGRLPEALI